MGVEIPSSVAPIKALDIGVIGRLARPAEVQLHFALICPWLHTFGEDVASFLQQNTVESLRIECAPKPSNRKTAISASPISSLF
jgi:hypothetical protein